MRCVMGVICFQSRCIGLLADCSEETTVAAGGTGTGKVCFLCNRGADRPRQQSGHMSRGADVISSWQPGCPAVPDNVGAG